MKRYDVIIVGGGLAGLTAAIHLSREKHTVLVLEKKHYPHHKVCGEYVSNESIPYLQKLGVDLKSSGAVSISKLELSTVKGKSIQTDLQQGGVGISRYAFDNLMYTKAASLKVDFEFESVISVNFENNVFQVFTDLNKSYTSTIVIGAYGKRSGIDKQLKRNFISNKSGWLGIKAHYEYDDFPENKVALHNFRGGYGGLSKTETGAVNFCYLVSYESFQKEKNVHNFNEKVVVENPLLEKFLGKAKPIFDKPMSIAQINFEQKKAVENHVLMCGDTAGLIHPLCGNGMSMAIHSAKIASELIMRYLKNDDYSRTQLEMEYQQNWSNSFRKRLWMGRQLQRVFLNDTLANMAMKTVTLSPLLLRKLIQSTHGKPIVC